MSSIRLHFYLNKNIHETRQREYLSFIPIFVQRVGGKLAYFKFRLFNLTEFIV